MADIEISESRIFLALEMAIANQAAWEKEHGYMAKSALLASWEEVRRAYLMDNARIVIKYDGRAF